MTIDLPEGSSVEATDAVAQAVAGKVLELGEVRSVQTHAGTAAPFNFNGLVRHSFLRSEPQQGDVAINLSPKSERSRSSHDIALDIRRRIAAIAVPAGTSLKVVEPPPGPPVMATLLAEIYGPDGETRRKVAARVEAAFRSVPFIVDVDNSWGQPARRLRTTISTDDAEFFHVEESDVFDTIAILNGGKTVGYSHRGGGRQPIPIRIERPKGERTLDERFLTTPIPANVLPGDRGVVEFGDVVRVAPERASFPVFRHNGRAAEMVTAELAGSFEAPLYGMLAVGKAIDAQDWTGLPKPTISLHGQPEDERKPTLLWDGEWEVTWVTFRDMGAAFGVALLGIYILVVAQFGSFKVPLVILTPIPLTFIGILGGHWLFGAPFTATSMIRLHRAGRHHRAQFDPAGRLHPARGIARQAAGRDPDRGRRDQVQADPADRTCRHDRRGGDPDRSDLPGAGDLAAVRPGLFDAADRAGHPGDLSGVADVMAARAWRNCRVRLLRIARLIFE